MKVEKLNRLLAERLGRTPTGAPKYKWVQAHQLKHYRYIGDDWVKVSKVTGLVAPTPKFMEVVAYPHLGQRWVFAVWQFIERQEWDHTFGSRVPWPSKGQYFPLLVMREGKKPDLDITEFFVGQVKADRAKTPADVESEMEAAMERDDRATWGRIYDMIDDATTAFGNDPGKRSGGVSFASKEFKRNAERVWPENRV